MTILYRNTITISLFCLVVGWIQGCQNSTSNTLVQQDPERAVKVRTQLAAEYIRSGDLDAAKRTLDQALHYNAKDAGANMMMGILLQQEASPNSLQQADHFFKRALKAEPKNAQVRNNYASYLHQMQRNDEAIKQLKIAGATLGYDQRYRALENLGQVYLSLGNIDEAEKSFQQALSVHRDSLTSVLELSEIYYLQRKFSAADQSYGHYLRMQGQTPASARVLWLGARIARANGDLVGMQAQLTQLQSLYPKSQEYQHYLQLQHSTEAVWK
ncbi:type IV pilus biogenesis/stability protein PilW [Acinetobacter rudis CIP 110305]|uniref:Type IV pilus biogenesis/stability protein PilW n=1 Tax=Acinetobacter rudis CIP 110305 TaxID=421052 RepID=S3MUA9_9GAMM|nr:type IV pilus biogenesis/stability protein PilW [Acinetobacter rudis CIP 110305]